MPKNMAIADRIIRMVLAAVVAILYAAGQISGVVAALLGLIAVIFLVTSSVGSCPLYTLTGISTLRKS